MNVPTIEMPVEEAKRAYREYREAVRRNPANREDKAVMLGYKALAKGRAVIDLFQALKAGGVDEKGRPRLAVGRAHWEWAWLDTSSDGSAEFRSERRWRPARNHTSKYVSVPAGTFQGTRYANEYRALVPTIPPRIRPVSLFDHFILWEADWQDAPGDPMLLRHLAGPLYAVLAVWDLTPLERAVLRQRMAAP